MIIKQHIKKKNNSKDSKDSKSSKSSKSSLDSKINGSLDNNLKTILDEADKITMNELEFDTIFKEQSKILCDIKTLLTNEKNGTITKCNIIGKNDNNFKQLLNVYKKKYSRNNIYSTLTKKNKPHRKSKSSKPHRKSKSSKPHRKSKSSKPHRKSKSSKPNRKSKSSKPNRKSRISRKTSKSIKSSKKKQSSNKLIQNAAKNLNLTYPIVLLKDKKPYKNVIMIKNNKE
jgi:hypothetical protein